MAEDMGERTEEPTPRKRSEARNEGRVVKSKDLSGAAELIGAALLLTLMGAWVWDSMGAIMRGALDPAEALGLDPMVGVAIDAGERLLRTAGPVLLGILVVGVLAQFLQVGFLFTTKPLEPKLDRLDPIKGFINTFGTQGLVKTGVGGAKLVLIALAGGLIMAKDAELLAGLPALGVREALMAVGGLALELIIWILVIMLLIGAADWMYQRWNHTKQLRMTKQEVEDERKSSDGDPQVKGRRHRMMREIAAHRTRQSVPTADVIVTNPTHFSVAIKYDATLMKAPRVVAKGADHMALQIRQIASSHGVPILERPPLARALYYAVEVGHEVPPAQYEAVAEVLAYVYRLKGKAAA